MALRRRKLEHGDGLLDSLVERCRRLLANMQKTNTVVGQEVIHLLREPLPTLRR